MKQKLGISLAALAVLASVGIAEAQVTSVAKRFVTFGIGGGMSVPVSDAADAFKNGVNAQAFVRFHPPALPVIPRIDLNYSKFDLDDAQTLLPGTSQILSGLAGMQVFLLPSGPIRPYVIAGLGAYSLKTETDGVGGISQSDVRFGINGGGGVQLSLGMIKAYVEGKVDNVYTESGMIDTDQIQVVPVTFGVTF
jgi:hypothetical protein